MVDCLKARVSTAKSADVVHPGLWLIEQSEHACGPLTLQPLRGRPSVLGACLDEGT